jgi:hypothetical protein
MLGLCRLFVTIFNVIVAVSYHMLWYISLLIILTSWLNVGSCTTLFS